MPIRLLRPPILAAVLALSAPALAGAQAPAPSLTLSDAIRLTLERAPSIQAVRAEVERQAGAARAEGGPFDTVFHLGPSFERSEVALRRQWQQVSFSNETSNLLSVSASVNRAMRSGATLRLLARVDSDDHRYKDDVLAGDLASFRDPSRFQSLVQAQWMQPLSRGRGRVSVAAAERAALRRVEAVRASASQAEADRALDVSVAYVELMAAQQMLALRLEALGLERTILDVTTRQAAAGEIPRADLTRAQARVAESEAAIAAARIEVVLAQSALAERIGLSPAEAGVQAADAFPAAPPAVDLAAAEKAVDRRADFRAAGLAREASRLLLDGARADTRSRVDLTVNAGVATAYYGPRTIGNYLDFYSPTGFGRSFSEKWQPFVAVALAIDLPWRNHAALGRLQQARAAVTDLDIRRADLARVIATNVNTHVAAVRIARQEWQQRQEAVTQHEATWTTTGKLRQAGEMSLIDTLLTEQDLTDSRLALVQAKRDYLVAAARYRYETGTLLDR
jgi:outer membrane protein TolC